MSDSNLIRKADCELLEYRDGQGVAKVETPDGYELPQVGFPEEVLKYHGLVPGDRFHWFTDDKTCEGIAPYTPYSHGREDPVIKERELSDPDSCMSRARNDEWTFVLLGRDKAAPATIRFWVAERIRLGKNTMSDDQILEALACADAIEKEQS